MSRIDFYHLQKQTLETALPKLLEKAYTLGKTIKIKVGNELRVDFLNSLLWTYDEESFLPHGTKKDGFGDMQPIWISADDDTPNNAELLFLVDAATIDVEKSAKFERIFNIFDGNNPDAVLGARKLWKDFKATTNELHYWQQDANGRWEEK